jgi:2TM domain
MVKISDARPADPTAAEQSARELAIKQIERKRAFQRHAATYAVGSIVLLVIWAVSEYFNAGGWPTNGFSQSSGIPGVWNIWIIYPLVGWGAFVAVHGWSTYLRKPISENEIEHEIERQSGPRH